ncbi:MAG: AraC family transcriptional regulator [Lachnospiraceae bacterium]|jgi:AraC family transcriptional regulator|nr:AraC family transcriptional regulator [Lachnospiraceae bacterium]
MNGVMDYIENNLDGNIEMDEIAKRANCSNFNFQRMFSFIADISLADYIRKRRLSLAAMELLSTDAKVIDIAGKYGYESPISFARAFNAVHGLNPSEVRKPGVKIKSYPRISFEITIKGVEAMNYRIEELNEFRFVGYKERVSNENGENFKRIPQFWDEVSTDGRCEKMMQYNDNKKMYCMGICANADENSFDYYIATGSSKEIPEDMAELIVPAGNYVIFECVGKLPESQQTMWKRVFTEWFPKSAYDLIDGPQIEWYSDGDTTSDEYYSEIWLPVKINK